MLQIIGNTGMDCALRNVNEAKRTLIVVLYGGMGGILSAGVLHALEHNGISPRNNSNISVIGVSAGAANVLGFCAGRLGESPSIYGQLAEHLRERFAFMKMFDVLAVEYLTEILKRELGTNFLDDCAGDVFAAVTRARDGVSQLRNLKEEDCPFNVTHASMRMPILFQGAVRIGDERFVDGACSASLVEMIRLVRPHQILIVGSRPLYGKLPPGESAISDTTLRLLSRAYSRTVREKAVRTDEALRIGLKRIENAKLIRSYGIFPAIGVPWNETDPEVLEGAFHDAYESTCELFT
ncbi:hypothetical protein COB18_02240 [Candidatus Kaiserbacteria bacterium]|nr:MAG: hypothetical protein COB18_02240 [Candidatus Kaiserbacteria bacterium]